MTSLLVITLIFLTTFVIACLAVLAGWLYLRRGSQSETPRAGESIGEYGDSPLLLKAEGFSTISLWNRLLASFDFVPRMKVIIADAGLAWSVGRVTAMMLLAGVVSLAALLQVEWLPGLVIAGGACGAAALPFLYVRRRRAKRLHRFEEQFPEALEFIARALRAGHPLAVSLEMLADESVPPLSIELRKTCDERHLGSSSEQALKNLAGRVPLMDVAFFVAAVQLHTRAGGRLTEVLERLAETMRERFTLKEEIRSLSAHGRMSGYVLTALPIVVAAVMVIFNPAYLMILLNNERGKLLVGLALGSLVLAHFVIRRIVSIKV